MKEMTRESAEALVRSTPKRLRTLSNAALLIANAVEILISLADEFKESK